MWKYYIQKNTYILKLLLNSVTAGIDAHVSGNKVLYACVKEVCRLFAHAPCLTPSINSFLKCCDTNQFLGYTGEIMAVRRWSDNSQLKCSYADTHCHGGALHRMSAFHAFCSVLAYVFRYTLSTLLSSLVAWMSLPTLLSCPIKQFPSTFWQTTFVWTFSACLVNVCASTALTAFWFQHSQMKPRFPSPVTVTMWLRNSSQFLWYRFKKSKPKSFSSFYEHVLAFSEPI
jgi:hypothetical protein